MTDKCYICNLDKSDSEPTDRKIRCIGLTFCIQLHGVHGQALSKLPETLTNKAKRAEASRCDSAQGDRFFHPTCLGRQSKGAFSLHSYQHDENTDICSKLDQTHRLCDDCLTTWCADGGTVGKLNSKGARKNYATIICFGQIGLCFPLGLNVKLQIFAHEHPNNKQTDIHTPSSSCIISTLEEPSSQDQKRRLDNKAYAARKREKQTLAKHAQLGDCKLLLSATRNGQYIPCMCPNMYGLWQKGGDPKQTDPSLQEMAGLYETIVTAWADITKIWYEVNSSKRVPTGKMDSVFVFCAYTTDSGMMYLGQVPILF